MEDIEFTSLNEDEIKQLATELRQIHLAIQEFCQNVTDALLQFSNDIAKLSENIDLSELVKAVEEFEKARRSE